MLSERFFVTGGGGFVAGSSAPCFGGPAMRCMQYYALMTRICVASE